MGVERAVTRWYARHQVIQLEIARLQSSLEQFQAKDEGQITRDPEYIEIEQQLGRAQAHLHDLGPCPRPMMG